jgi:hypothetical protein
MHQRLALKNIADDRRLGPALKTLLNKVRDSLVME